MSAAGNAMMPRVKAGDRDVSPSRRQRSIVPACVLALAAAAAYAQSPIVEPGAAVELLADGFRFTEGPACDPGGNVYFTDQPNDRIHVWSVDRRLSIFKQGSGRANRLSFDRAGNLWACADADGELRRLSLGGETTVAVAEYRGKRLNGPNDIWIRPDGGIYFTDPFYPRDYWDHREATQNVQGVYYLDPEGKEVRRVAEDLLQPNGIIGTPDGTTLYVADMGARKTYRYDIRSDGALDGKRLFCDMGSDGMTIDNEGNVYLTGSGVTVFNPEGKRIHHIPVQAGWTANVCFGGRDRRTLFITASDTILGLRMRVRGVDSQ